MRQFRQRIVLIHELRQLGRSEELLHRCSHRLDVDQRLRSNAFNLLCGHALTHDPLKTAQADAVLILKQLAHRTDAAVAKMVDIIAVSDAELKMHIIIDGSENILFRNVLRDQVVNMEPDILFRALRIKLSVLSGIPVQEFLQVRIINQLGYAKLLRIAVDVGCEVDHHVGQDFHIPLFGSQNHTAHSRVLDPVSHLLRHLLALGGKDLSGRGIHYVLRQHMSGDTVSEQQLLVVLITPNLGKVIAPRIEEHAVDQALRALHRERLARTDLLVQLAQAALIIVALILLKSGKDLGLFAEQLQNLRIRPHSQGADKRRDRNLTGPVHTHVEYVI